MADTLKLVTISGSLRAKSFNTMLINALPELAPPALHFTSLDWSAVPIYNGDVEQAGIPQVVTALHGAIRGSDGLIIATPEYNHGVPGPLKNLLDWLSVGKPPHGLYGVPVAICGCSNGTIGTTRSQAMLRQTLAALNAPTLPFPQVLVATAQDRFDDQGKLVHESTREFVGKWLVEVERWMRKFPRTERGG